MATFSGGITNAGLALIDQQLTGAGTINLVNVKTGSGQPGGGGYTAQTSLTTVVQTITPDSANALVNYQTTVRFTVNSGTVGTAYTLSEIGIFAQIGSGPVVLFAYYSANPGDSITATTGGSPILYEYAIVLGYSQATSVTVSVTLTSTVALHAATHLGAGTSLAGVDPIPTASQANTGLCPASPNDATQVVIGSNPAAFGPVPLATISKQGGLPKSPNNPTQVPIGGNPPSWGSVPQVAPANPGGLPPNPAAANYSPVTLANGGITWLPILPVIIVNTTLFVFLGANNVYPNFSSIQNALSYLYGYTILSGVTVTVSVASGVYVSPTQIVVDHPNGQQIQIIGSIGSSISTISASSSGTTVTLTASPGGFSTISPGDYILSYCTTGPSVNGIAQSGVYKVLACNGTILTYTSNSSLSLSGYTFTVQKLNSVLAFGPGVNGIYIFGGGIGLLQNFAIIGNPSGSTPIIGTSVQFCVASLDHCGINNWNDTSLDSLGLETSNSGIANVTNCFSTLNTVGFESIYKSAQMNLTACFAVGNTFGFRNQSSQMVLNGCFAASNNASGIEVSNGGSASLSGLATFSVYNGNYGTDLSILSTLGTGTSSPCFFAQNGTRDISLTSLSIFFRGSGVAATYSTESADSTCVFSP